MPFVKLDQGILDSTLWVERECREVFITALLMAHPYEFEEPIETYEVRSTNTNGYIVPPGWYGMVPAAGPAIVRRAMVDDEAGMVALERLASPDLGSRSADFEGRRMVRINGGYLILNYMKYREKDHTAAERQKRYRERKFNKLSTGLSKRTSHRNGVNVTRNITQAEVEAYKDLDLHGPIHPELSTIQGQRPDGLQVNLKTLEPERDRTPIEEHNRRIAELIAQGKIEEAKILQANTPE